MRIVLEYQDKIYYSERTSELTADQAAEKFYDIMSTLKVMKLNGEGGSILVFGVGVIQNCILRFEE